MFDKGFTMSKTLLQVQALKGRVEKNHHKIPEIEEKIKILKSGYNGEKVINYYLSQIPNEKYHIFHNLRLPNGDTFFQIDFLLLSSKILIIEGKNHSGTIYIEKNQMVQEGFDKKEIYENPITQANRHKILLSYLFHQNNISYIPIDYVTVFTRNTTEIKITPGYTEAEEKICKAGYLLKKIEEFEKTITNRKPQEIAEIRDLLLTKDTPIESNVLDTFQINKNEIIPGVRCPKCLFLPMGIKRNTWICPICDFKSKDAHLPAIQDYSLLINSFFTNSEIRNFLHLPSCRTTNYFLSLMDLNHTGNTSNRIYHFPITANYVFLQPIKQ